MLSLIGEPADEDAEAGPSDTPWTRNKSTECVATTRPASPRRPLSPKSLAPLIIPASMGNPPERVVVKKSSFSMFRSGRGTPPTVPPKSPRLDGRASPYPRAPYTPYTPISASTSCLSASLTGTPLSGLPENPQPNSYTAPVSARSNTAHNRTPPDTANTKAPSDTGKRREQSDTSVMERGRPTRRRRESDAVQSSMNKRSASEEQKVFATLPPGVRAVDANVALGETEVNSLLAQALGQAARFEVLSMKDVKSLSRV